jgi:hypothetical protein
VKRPQKRTDVSFSTGIFSIYATFFSKKKKLPGSDGGPGAHAAASGWPLWTATWRQAATLLLMQQYRSVPLCCSWVAALKFISLHIAA